MGLLIVNALAICSALVLGEPISKWAVLVAGSNTWSNYRHQSDIYHTYSVLIKDNFPKEKIITMAYNDIALNARNPFKGKVFNHPSFKNAGVDVYAGVSIDYSHNAVTPEVFLAVLEGNKTAVKGIGSGRVLEVSPSDNVFVFFSDHGASGLIAFPDKYLYADDLLNALRKMRGHFNKLVFYL